MDLRVKFPVANSISKLQRFVSMCKSVANLHQIYIRSVTDPLPYHTILYHTIHMHTIPYHNTIAYLEHTIIYHSISFHNMHENHIIKTITCCAYSTIVDIYGAPNVT